MILGNRVTSLRENLSLSKQELADLVGVTSSTIANWENWKSSPTSRNLELLAIMLCTTTDYLQGLTDEPSSEPISADSTPPPADSAQTLPAVSSPNVCEDCGTPIPERLRKCHSCRWKTRWPESLLNSSRLATRRKRSHSTQLLSLDREKPEAIFGSSTDKNRTTYITTLETCTCRDFELTHGEIPCKHILRLAGEMGFFQSEYFAAGEDDYTMHVAPTPEAVTQKQEFGVVFQPVFVDKPMGRPSYLPSEPQMAEWKSKLFACTSIQEGIQLIADLRLTIPDITALAEYLGVSLTGCEYQKSAIVRRLVEGIFADVNAEDDNASEAVVSSVTDKAEFVDIAETSPELSDPVSPVPPKIPRSPGIFVRLLKYALCCFFGFWAIVFILLAVKGDKAALCFPVAFTIAGLLTANTARRNALEGSAFSWWLYGALVPVVSWVDVVMACSQNKVKGFIRGVIYSLLGIVAFLIVFVQFLPAVPKP